jgi:DNA-binding transcriptional MerR regulator
MMKGGFEMYSAKEAAEMTGLTTATLRYYEKEQLLPAIERTEQRYRQYSDTDIEWINMIQCLRMANVPIRSIREYILLLTQGGKTILQRRLMVQEYIDDLHSQMVNLQNALALTEKKLVFYEELLQSLSAQDLTYLEEWNLFKSKGES